MPTKHRDSSIHNFASLAIPSICRTWRRRSTGFWRRSKEGAHRIYGDYDVDGVTSSALLQLVLRAAGATVTNFLPHRMDEGYGLTQDGIARCLREHKPQLLVAVDCGTSSVREIADLKNRKVDTIVLDHHEPAEQLPQCVALVNPKRDWSRDVAPGCLASVGAAFKLAHALLKHDRRLSERDRSARAPRPRGGRHRGRHRAADRVRTAFWSRRGWNVSRTRKRSGCAR